jgi:hypothetical protein
MPDKNEILVVPRRRILDGKGCIWEMLLMKAGYNELPWNEIRLGVVVGIYKLENKSIVVDIEWPGVNHISKNVFLDELARIEERLETKL